MRSLRHLFRSRILALAAALGVACSPHPKGIPGQRLACYLAMEAATDIGPPVRGSWVGPAPRPRYCYEQTLVNVYRCLSRHVDEHGVCWLSVELIAQRSRVDVRTARRALGWLAHLGWILRRERWRRIDHLAHLEPRTTLYMVLTRPLDEATIARVPSVLEQLGGIGFDEELEDDVLDEELDAPPATPAPTRPTSSTPTRPTSPTPPPATPAPSSPPATPPPSPSSSSSADEAPGVQRVQAALTALSLVANRPDLNTPEALSILLGAGRDAKKNPATLVAALEYVAGVVRGRQLEGVPFERGELGELITRMIKRERIVAEPEPPAPARRAEPAGEQSAEAQPSLRPRSTAKPSRVWLPDELKDQWKALGLLPGQPDEEPTDEDRAELERLRALQTRGPP